MVLHELSLLPSACCIILKDIYLQVLLYFTIFAFVEMLREFTGLWFNFDIRAVTIESSTQLLWAMVNVNKICAFCSIYGVSGVAFSSRCKTRFVCEFISYRTCVAHSRTEFAVFASFGWTWSTVTRSKMSVWSRFGKAWINEPVS